MENEPGPNEFHGTDKEWRERVLEETKKHVTNFGRKLSLILVEFLVDMSGDGDEETASLLRRVRSCFEHKIRFSTKLRDDHSTMVLDKTFALLETWERKLRDRDEARKLKHKGVLVTKPIARLITRKQEFAYPIIASICKQIMFLEESVCLVLRETVSEETMKRNLVQQQKELKDIDLDSIMGYVLFTMKEKSDGLNTLLDPMKNVVEQLWNDFEFC